MRVRVNQNGGIKRYLDQAAAGLFIRGIACGQILHDREAVLTKGSVSTQYLSHRNDAVGFPFYLEIFHTRREVAAWCFIPHQSQ